MEPLNSHVAPPPERVAEDLERPILDTRTYRVIKLKNELEALLVHDPDTDKVSAALDVNVGSFSDADDMPGMAHAVEHLLFMGTKKFPVENAYNQYLSAHSGYSNAFTASTSTNYFFEVAAESEPTTSKSTTETDIPVAAQEESPLYGALDRFSQFFVEPLFLADTVGRELRAVDSENKKNLQSDNWRLNQLNKTLSNPEHPYCHFSTGNFKTLHDEPLARGVQIRDEFIKFYEKHYSANRMKLVVLGRESLDTLEQWVEELFSTVPNKNLPRNRWDHVSPYTKNELGMQIFTKPVTEMRSMDLYFPYQDEEHLFESQPNRYLSHLIGHEGPGSILAYLKAKGWANGLGAGSVPVCPGSSFFSISIKLTQEGLKQYKEVTKVVFQYIAMMRETPPQEWIYDELKRMSEVDFRFKQKSPASRTTSSLSGIMQKPYPREWLLSGPALIRKFNPEAISSGLGLLNPDNFRLTVVSQDFPGGWNQKEKWYGTEYKYEPMESNFLKDLRTATNSKSEERPAELHLPHKNEFIPTRLDVEKKEIMEPTKVPKLIRNDEKIRIWYKKDDRFWVPKANVMITLRTPLISMTPRNSALAHMLKELVSDALVEYSYDAEIAGVDYSISTHAVGIDITLSGYNDKMPVLLEKVLTSVRDFEIKDERFNIVQERVVRGFRNWDYQQPYFQVGTYTGWLNTERSWINEQYLVELPHLTPDDVRAFHPQLLSQVHVEVLAHGNLYKEEVLKMTDLAEKILRTRSLPPAQWPIRRSMVYPSGADFSYTRPLKDPANVNHCIEYLLYVGSPSERSQRAKLLLFAQMTEEPVFDTLRTKEQLGYVVFSGARIQNMWAGYRVLIQSEKTPEYLEGRVEEFLKGFSKTLNQMDEPAFEKHKRSLINKRKEKLKNLTQESSRFWGHICNERYDFLQGIFCSQCPQVPDHDVEHIAALTKDAMQAFFDTYISPSSPLRSKLTVNLRAQASPLSDDDATASIPTPEIADAEPLSESSTGAVSAVKAQVESIVEKAKAVVGASSTEGEKELEKDKKTQKIIIEDVHAWKAGLSVSRGLSPVQDLSEFEDFGSKL
ncbi:LuxS/MPP-like metallohydrolase [Pseudovirgaria hyperparasitica]|uniref:LuxS/MPP-like metallohydrolase n=1 Tax=Pseudovirgaria hyperparasitica TaxID=470096 RepID=A0A6A6VYU8_9PEZI|nr:LuxS/MPP-like metallohydrolase [Pseudovirgaria hyperparasitica]KAF2754860.1 LuxS/MPP-like metallohydrolase [Pseudovirgaria hyperparasitica]